MNCSDALVAGILRIGRIRSTIQTVRVPLMRALGALLALVAASSAAGGAEAERLTRDGQLKFAPCFSPGGEAVVYSVHDVPNHVSLKRLNLLDGTTEVLEASSAPHLFDPAYAGDGRLFCYARSSTSPQLVLVIRDVLANKEVTFTPEGERSTVRTPRFTPDAKRVVFTLSAPGGQQIASVNVAATDLQRLTQSPGINCYPAVSPDGHKIAFSSSRDGEFEIYLMSANGDNVERLTHSPRSDLRPAWSPDGEQIAFTSTRHGNHEIYIMRRDGSGVRRITHDPQRDDYPTWHPDGQRLLIVAERAGQCDLYLIDVP
jgi:Tol biopolymer transport system component